MRPQNAIIPPRSLWTCRYSGTSVWKSCTWLNGLCWSTLSASWYWCSCLPTLDSSFTPSITNATPSGESFVGSLMTSITSKCDPSGNSFAEPFMPSITSAPRQVSPSPDHLRQVLRVRPRQVSHLQDNLCQALRVRPRQVSPSQNNLCQVLRVRPSGESAGPFMPSIKSAPRQVSPSQDHLSQYYK